MLPSRASRPLIKATGGVFRGPVSARGVIPEKPTRKAPDREAGGWRRGASPRLSNRCRASRQHHPAAQPGAMRLRAAMRQISTSNWALPTVSASPPPAEYLADINQRSDNTLFPRGVSNDRAMGTSSSIRTWRRFRRRQRVVSRNKPAPVPMWRLADAAGVLIRWLGAWTPSPSSSALMVFGGRNPRVSEKPF